MRGHFRFGLVALSLVSLLAVLGRAGISAALDNPPPPAVIPAVDFGPPPQEVAVASDDFGPPPRAVARLDLGPFADPSADPFAGTADVVIPRPGADSFGADDPFAAAPSRKADRPKGDANREKRDRLASLVAEAASVVCDAELDRFIAEFEATVAEKRAEAELREARAALEQVVAAFPQTGAADAAREMLGRRAEAPAKVMPVEAPR